MDIQHRFALLIGVTGIVCLICVAAAIRKRRWSHFFGAIGAALVLACAVIVGSLALPGRNCILTTWVALAQLDRTTVMAWSAGFFFGAFVAYSLVRSELRWTTRTALMAAYLLVVVCLSLLTLKERVSLHLVNQMDTGSNALFEQKAAPGFSVQEYCQLSIAPTCLCVGPDQELYVAGYGGIAYQNGMVVRIDPPSDAKQPQEVRVASYLNRVHGIAWNNGNLFVSRAGQWARAVQGKIVQENTGTVTKLQDLDGDGKFDFFTDVVKDLPGAQLPDGLHQNNGITFNKTGDLFITVGISSDSGPATHPYAGCIMKLAASSSKLEVFARGFRNPYGITIGPNEQIYCTDNDPDSTNPGDALFRVVPGKHHGHPFNRPTRNREVAGVVKPLLRSRAALEGIAYAPPNSLPDKYSDCLYIASYGGNHVKRVQIFRDGEQYRAEMDHFFAAIPQAIDVAISTKERVIYVCSYQTKKVYRIRHEE